MSLTALPISRLVNVDVILTPAAASIQDIHSLLILGTSDVIDTTERYRVYSTIDEVAIDFGTTSEEYLAAVLWFEQSPQPDQILIGKWADVDTSARLVGATLTAAQQVITLWSAITNPTFEVDIDGVTQDLVVGSFAAVTNLNGVASLIQTALQVIDAGITFVWDANYERFVFTNGSTGPTSTLSFLTTSGVGTDISGMLKMLSTDSGAYVVNGIAAETAVEAVTVFDINFGQNWYAITIPSAVNADHLLVAAYIEATDTKHIYGVTTQESGVLVSNDTSNIAYQLKALDYDRTVVQYSSENAYAVCSLLARLLTVDYTANNSTITLMYKQEPGIVAETINSNQATAIDSFNANVFVNYRNDTAIIQYGKMVSGEFADIITGTDWLALEIQSEVYNLLYTSPTKIPQTDPGNALIATKIAAVCQAGVNNGLIAPGVWDSAGFGSLKQGDFIPNGFYIFAPPVSSQLSADRAARKSVSFQVAIKLAGAVHTVSVQINVNR